MDNATYDGLLEDLRELCRALDLFDGARSASPRQVMRECIAEARRLTDARITERRARRSRAILGDVD